MGFNTVVMFHNDAYGDFSKHPDETMENILKAMNGVGEHRHHYGVGSHANPMRPMKPRHADDQMIYVHAGNTLCEMRTYSQETEDLMKNHPEFFQTMLRLMEYEVKELKKKFKELKKK